MSKRVKYSLIRISELGLIEKEYDNKYEIIYRGPYQHAKKQLEILQQKETNKLAIKEIIS